MHHLLQPAKKCSIQCIPGARSSKVKAARSISLVDVVAAETNLIGHADRATMLYSSHYFIITCSLFIITLEKKCQSLYNKTWCFWVEELAWVVSSSPFPPHRNNHLLASVVDMTDHLEDYETSPLVHVKSVEWAECEHGVYYYTCTSISRPWHAPSTIYNTGRLMGSKVFIYSICLDLCLQTTSFCWFNWPKDDLYIDEILYRTPHSTIDKRRIGIGNGRSSHDHESNLQ